MQISTPRRLVAALALLVAVPPATASAAPSWQEGELRYTTGFLCSSLIFGPPILASQTGAAAAFQADDQDLPHAGDVFYTRVVVGVAGDPCGGSQVLPEWVLPKGVTLAVDKAHPVRWTYAAADAASPQLFDTGTRLETGLNGGVVIAATVENPDGGPWPLAAGGDFLQIEVPLRSERRLVGIGSGLPNCTDLPEGTPCPPERAGDHLQVAVSVADGGTPGTISPYIGLFVREPAPPTVTGPKLVTASAAKRGVALTIRTAPRARVTLGLRVGTRSLLQVTVRADAAGLARATLKLTQAQVDRVRAATAGAVLRTVARATDGSTSNPSTRPLKIPPLR